MASVNKVILVGHLGRDPETRYMPDGGAICNISVATTSAWKDKSGEKQEQTEWHRVSFFGKLAEIADEYLKKGSQLYVEGKLRTRKWQDKDGQDKYTTEVIADTMQMLGARGSSTGSASESTASTPGRTTPNRQQTAKNAAQARTPAHAGGSGFDNPEDDIIPF